MRPAERVELRQKKKPQAVVPGVLFFGLGDEAHFEKADVALLAKNNVVANRDT